MIPTWHIAPSNGITDRCLRGRVLTTSYGSGTKVPGLVRDEYGPDPARDAVVRPRWLSGLALGLELGGLWLALGARIQLGFFAWEKRNGIVKHVLVRGGFYRFIRHPVNAGIYLALVAWPIAYAAPLSALLAIVVIAAALRGEIVREEKMLIERYGDEYRRYQDETDAMIPNIW